MNPREIKFAEEALDAAMKGWPQSFKNKVSIYKAAEYGLMVAKARLKPIGATGPPVYLHPDDPRAMLGNLGH